MALVKCAECGRDVSDQAATCPNCGAAVRKPAPKKSGCRGPAVLLAVAFVLLLVMGQLMNGGQAPPKQTHSPQEEKENAILQNALRGASALKNAMRNPDSFKLESALIVEGTNDVCYDYRSQNGFGGMNREQALLSATTGMLMTEHANGFAKAWNKLCADKHGLDATVLLSQRLSE